MKTDKDSESVRAGKENYLHKFSLLATSCGRRAISLARRYENTVIEHGEERVKKAARLAKVTGNTMFTLVNLPDDTLNDMLAHQRGDDDYKTGGGKK